MNDEEWIQKTASKAFRVIHVPFIVFGMAFWAVNLFVLFLGEPTAFQRLGSLWVAVLVAFFGFGRLFLRALELAINDPGAMEIIALRKPNNRWIAWIGVSDAVRNSFKVPEERVVATQVLRRLESYFAIKVYPSEFVYLFLSTLQWGYGDLFHCWGNGQGWQQC